MPKDTPLSRWLNRAKDVRNVGQADLVRLTGFTDGYVSQLFTGDRQGSRKETRRVLAQAYGYSLAEFDDAVATFQFPEPRVSGAETETERAIVRDTALTPAQRMALIEVYRSFLAPARQVQPSRERAQ